MKKEEDEWKRRRKSGGRRSRGVARGVEEGGMEEFRKRSG